MSATTLREAGLRAPAPPPEAPRRSRGLERVLLLAVTALVLVGFWRVREAIEADLREAERALAASETVDLGALQPGAMEPLDAVLARGRYLTDPADRALFLSAVDAYVATGEGFENVGRLNTRDLRIPLAAADSLGGPVYRRRAASAREAVGIAGPLAPEARALPSVGGPADAGVSLNGVVRDAEGRPLAGAVVALARVPPFYADSLLAAAAHVDTTAADPATGRGRAITGRTEAEAPIPFAFDDTLRTDARGRFEWRGLLPGYGYTVRPLVPGLTFGSRQGVARQGIASLGEEGAAGLWRRVRHLDWGAPTFVFEGQPHEITAVDRFTFDRLKRNALVARAPEAVRAGLWRVLALFLVPFWAVHLVWSARRFQGDRTLLPLAMALSGLAVLVLMGLPDPLRDRDLAGPAAWGFAVGTVLLGAVALTDVGGLREGLWRGFTRLRAWAAGLSHRWTGWPAQEEPGPLPPLAFRLWMRGFVWVALAFGLAGLVILFGGGPEGSGAKVNLLGVQPSEVVKLLMVLFFASYLAETADEVRLLRAGRRWRYALGIGLGILVMLAMYALQGDLGPALVVTLTLVGLWGIARGRWVPVLLGVGLIAGGFVAGAALVTRVGNRVAMWLSPWDNGAYGGDHLAHALWTLATGGWTGRGLGRGSAYAMPEAHTDMILPSVGEDLGLLGLLLVLALVGVLLLRGARIALRAATPFATFLGLGIVLATGLQFLLIAGGSLGLLPLTGVSVPFLSFGKATALVNFVALGMLASLSARPGDAEQHEAVLEAYRVPVGVMILAGALALGVVGARLVQLQAVQADDHLLRPALVAQRSGLRAFSYNPRIGEVRDAIPPGTVYDRNGVPLATSERAVIAETTDELAELGATGETLLPPRPGARVYPMGDLTAFLVGDANTRLKWGTDLFYAAEYEHLEALRGFDNHPERVPVAASLSGPFRPGGDRDTTYATPRYDYRELFALVKAGPDGPEMDAFAARDRDVWLTVDARLQDRMATVLRQRIEADSRLQGKRIAAVALDAATGDLLASVNLPLAPAVTEPDRVAADPAAYDRAMYVRRAPGSTLKVATAIAAYREMGLAADDWTTTVTRGAGGADPQDPQFPLRADEPTGVVGMEQAIVRSSNAYFRQITTEANLVDDLLEVYDRFGITVGLPTWRERQRLAALRHGYEARWAAMGQGLVTAAPLNLAHLATAVARGGDARPVRTVLRQGGVDRPLAAAEPVLAPEAARRLDSYLAQVRGSSAAPLPRIGVAGKTGTASVAGAPNDGWYVGYKAMPQPWGEETAGAGPSALVICVLVEGGRTSARAAELAHALFSDLL